MIRYRVSILVIALFLVTCGETSTEKICDCEVASEDLNDDTVNDTNDDTDEDLNDDNYICINSTEYCIETDLYCGTNLYESNSVFCDENYIGYENISDICKASFFNCMCIMFKGNCGINYFYIFEECFSNECS